MTWTTYAKRHGKCFLQLVDQQWFLHLPTGRVSVKNIDEARRFASEHGCTVIL